FYELGLGDPFSISAESGRKVGDLLDYISQKIPESSSQKEINEDIINLAIIGMPNVGKSSLMNSLLQEDKAIVTNIAGTTRDSIDSFIRYYGKTYRIIDTAGLRKINKMDDSIEYYSSVRTFRVIDECDIAIMMIDASKGFCSHDRNVARYIVDQGKGMLLVINKWDTIEKNESTMKQYREAIYHYYRAMEHYPTLFVSVFHNKRVRQVLEYSKNIYDEFSKKIKTQDLNEFIRQIVQQYNPPAVKGKDLKIKYMTQVHKSPPIFAIFSNYPELFPVNYKRYIENKLRDRFGFKGVPIKLSFRLK
ncbi:MAG: ribosome biogenesis GTPase Der, partial [Fidelibacterota bacterium]